MAQRRTIEVKRPCGHTCAHTALAAPCGECQPAAGAGAAADTQAAPAETGVFELDCAARVIDRLQRLQPGRVLSEVGLRADGQYVLTLSDRKKQGADRLVTLVGRANIERFATELSGLADQLGGLEELARHSKSVLLFVASPRYRAKYINDVTRTLVFPRRLWERYHKIDHGGNILYVAGLVVAFLIL